MRIEEITMMSHQNLNRVTIARLGRVGVVMSMLLGLGACGIVNDKPRYSIDPDARGPVTNSESPSSASASSSASSLVAQSTDKPVTVEAVHQTDLPPPPPPPPPTQTAKPAAQTGPGVASVPVTASETGYTYSLGAHDTVYGVSRRFGVPVHTLFEINGLNPQSVLKIGQKIALPGSAKDLGTDPHAGGPGMTPVARVSAPKPARPVAPASAPDKTADKSGTTPSVAVPAKPSPAAVSSGSISSAAANASESSQTSGNAAPASKTKTASTEPLPKGFPSAETIAERGKGRFVWPLKGDIVVKFGGIGPHVKNDGINIAAAEGTPVQASATGEVAYVGSDVKALGLTVYIKDGGGFYTGYSHLKSTRLKTHQHVNQGETIGMVGKSGAVTSPQLHFEIRYTPSSEIARPIDPALVLP